ncbi:iron-sulfur cluster carrier protein ApbC [Vibrio gallicus]|uniref:iron-sulfur cluster carrier protein ApbC n=1 Tax=Vibrio gallicus TaxID=190897 RepID=UPI0021C2E419|nr:iron-sulfur cluster carrier protein ApbC [Vibrio gallicus]
MSDSLQSIQSWLNQFSHPALIEGWASEHGVVSLDQTGDTAIIEFPFQLNLLEQALDNWLINNPLPALKTQISSVTKALNSKVPSNLAHVKNIIAVTSGKGGVGKSTTAANLALAIAQNGGKVGVLDADIYGPSIPMMFGRRSAQMVVVDEKWMQPVDALGIQTQSIGYLMGDDEATVWRGPMASKALVQLLQETQWHDLDYLIIDMPPGTGDIQLTLAQQIPLTAAIVVTTPQDIALADASKGIAMFEKVEVPVLGIIENMSYHECSHCGSKEHIFGTGGAEKLAKQKGMALLGQIPLHVNVQQDVDKGFPSVLNPNSSDQAKHYLDLAEQIVSRLYWTGTAKPENIEFVSV